MRRRTTENPPPIEASPAEGALRRVPIEWEPLERDSLPSLPEAEPLPDERPFDVRLAVRFGVPRGFFGPAGCLIGIASFLAAPAAIAGMMVGSQIATRRLIGMTPTEDPATLFECAMIVVGTVLPLAAAFGAAGLYVGMQKRAERLRLERRLAERAEAAALLADPAAQLGLSDDDLDRLFAFQHRGDRWLLLARKDDVPRVARSDDRDGLQAAYSFASLRQRDRGVAGEHQRSMNLLWRRERPIWPGADEDGERRHHECRELPPFDAIRLRAASATPGDWRFVPSADEPGAIELRAFRPPGTTYESIQNGDTVGTRIFTSRGEWRGVQAEANRKFLVRARSDIEWMLKELEQESAPLSLEGSEQPGLLVAADFLEERGEDFGAAALRKLVRRGYVETSAFRARRIEIQRDTTIPLLNQIEERRLAGIAGRLHGTTPGDWVWEARFGEGGYSLVAREPETSGFRKDSGIEEFFRRSGRPRPEDRPPPSIPIVFVPFDAWGGDDQDTDDRRFIAHARSDALRLLEELAALKRPARADGGEERALSRCAALQQEAGFAREGELMKRLADGGAIWLVADESSYGA